MKQKDTTRYRTPEEPKGSEQISSVVRCAGDRCQWKCIGPNQYDAQLIYETGCKDSDNNRYNGQVRYVLIDEDEIDHYKYCPNCGELIGK